VIVFCAIVGLAVLVAWRFMRGLKLAADTL
jgi:hypothetical protein